jgi:hypothetical protein
LLPAFQRRNDELAAELQVTIDATLKKMASRKRGL